MTTPHNPAEATYSGPINCHKCGSQHWTGAACAEDKKIIDFKAPQKDGEPMLMPRKRGWRDCERKCRRLWIDEKSRELECRDCGAIYDPFNWLMETASKQSDLWSEITRLADNARIKRAEISVLEDEIKALKTEKRNAKRAAL